MGFDLDLNAIKSTVSGAAVGAVEKVAGDKVDKKVVTDTVNTVVDQAVDFANKKIAEKTSKDEKQEEKK